MTPDQLKALIRQAIVELVAPQPRRALVVFTGGLLGFEESLSGLRALAAEGVALSLVQTPSARRVLDQEKIAALCIPEVDAHLVADHEMLIAPTLTGNIAAKVAHGVADCLASNLFSEFIMSGRLVVASSTAIDPDQAPKRSVYPSMPSGYADLLRQNLATLTSFGVRLGRCQTLARTALAAFDRRDAEHKQSWQALGISPRTLTAALGQSTDTLPVPRPHGGGVHHGGESAGVSTRSKPAARVSALGAPATSAVNCTLTLISQGVVQKLDPGTQLTIRRGTKVTAAARDMAASRDIQITVVN